jgi:xanthine dehydrogenase accessory factor
MVVTENEFNDTLGGGALEHEAIEHAREILKAAVREPVITHRQFVLGSDLTQCCGGRVKLQFDCHWANDFILHVFGAGHVAQEVARLVQRLSCRAIFHDSRQEWLDKLTACIDADTASSPTSVTTSVLSDNVFTAVEACRAGSYFVVMTHSHELDMELVEAILARADSRYCGLIASRSKALSFRNRLKRKGFTEDELAGLTAPLGQHFQTGNTPMEVAIAAVSDVLHLRNFTKTTTDVS